METVREGIAADDLARKDAKTCRNPCHTLNFKANKHHSEETRVGGQKACDFVQKDLFLTICPHFIVPIKGALFADVHECHALFRLALRQVVGDESFQFFEQLENTGDTEAIQKYLECLRAMVRRRRRFADLGYPVTPMVAHVLARAVGAADRSTTEKRRRGSSRWMSGRACVCLYGYARKSIGSKRQEKCGMERAVATVGCRVKAIAKGRCVC
jgi:hypothetical protein